MLSNFPVQPSALYVVATPIGNLDDITYRAVSVLNGVDLICCEDTRHSARLLEHIGCKKPLLSLHEHNERERSEQIVQKLESGQSIALISDAGTPLISDPGFVLVKIVAEAGLKVIPIPGVSAAVTAMSVAGLPTDRWVFEGFLPNKTGARVKYLEGCLDNSATLVFYESSHRILASLKDMADVFSGSRPVVVARELTKTFETVLRGTLDSVIATVEQDSNQQKGEFVVLVQGEKEQQESFDSPEVVLLATELKPLLPPKKAASVIASIHGGSKKAYYELILRL